MSEDIQVVQVGAAGAALAQASAALALQYKNETSTLKGQVDTAKAAVDVAKEAVDVAKGQVDTAKAAVDVAKAAVDASQADVIARQAVVVAAQATTEGARDTAVAQAGVATTKAAESAGSASLALAIFGTADNLNAAQQIMLGYANTAQGAAGQAQAYAASAASVAQQDLSGVTAAKLHSSPNAVTAMCVYDVSKDSDGGAWVERCTAASWFNEALNGVYLPDGFASEMDARDYLGSYAATSIVTGDSSTAGTSVGAWATQNGNGTVTAPSGRFRLTLTAALGNTAGMALSIPTTVGQRYQIAVDFVTENAANTFLSAGTASGNNSLASLNMTTALGTRRLSFVATGTTTYINVYGSTTWAQNSFAEVDNITVKPVTFADPAGAYYQLNTDGKFYRPYKNLLANSGFQGGTSGTWGSGAAAPTGWSGPSATGSITFSASSRYAGEQQVQYVATAQRPYLQSGNITFPANTTTVISAYVETLASGTPTIIDVLALGSAISGATTTYRKNGGAATSSTTFTTGDFLEVIVTTGSTAGTVPLRHGLGANGNATGDVTLSPPQVEYVNGAAGLATTYESKAVGVGSQAEVFRGNKAKFPRLAAIVAEAASLTIYDLTESGRPMWMRFAIGGADHTTSNMLGGAGAGIASIAAMAGDLLVGAAADLRRISLVSDSMIRYSTAGVRRYLGDIARRQSGSGTQVTSTSVVLANQVVNAVAMCVMPDAPVDPVTGLQVPTIACFVATGISIIQNDGTVRNSSSTAAWSGGQITKDMLLALRTSDLTALWYAAKPGALGAAFGINQIAGAAAPGFNDGTGSAAMAQFGRSMVAARQGARLALLRMNETTPAQSLAAWIGATYNTGWWCGDIRRVWCADTVAGTASGAELLLNGDFSAGSANWVQSTPTRADYDFTGNKCRVTNDWSNGSSTGFGVVAQAQTLTPGKQYRLTGTLAVGSSAISINSATNSGGSGPTTLATFSSTGAFSVLLTPTVAGTYLTFAVNVATDGAYIELSNLSLKEVVADRCYKAKPATIYGTLTRTAVAAGAQLVAYSGFSNSNYIQEPYSADLDFGTGAWTCSAVVTVPTVLSPANFPVIGANAVSNGDMASDTVWGKGAGWAISGGVATHSGTAQSNLQQSALTAGQTYLATMTVSGGAVNVYAGSGSSTLGLTGSVSTMLQATDAWVYVQATTDGVTVDNVSYVPIGPAIIAERAHSSGPSIRVGVTGAGRLVAVANDGTTTRTVTTTASYNTGTRMKVRASYTTDGTLSISVNGRAVASTYGTPLLTMNNASAVTTTGQSRALDAPFPGDIALVKWGATVPPAEHMLWMYEQEKQMFRPGAQVTLPDTKSLVDVAYDDLTDTVTTVSAANEAHFNGLVRTSAAAVPAGAYTRVARGSGVKLLARSTTNPGVDVTTPSQNLKEELLRAEDAARRARLPMTFDYVGGFAANVTNGSTALASVTGLSVPAGVNLRGVTVTGTGIPASTVITDIVGTTVYISKPATATNTGVSISMLEFPLPTGYETEGVATAGALKQEGATKDWTRSFDGFVERPTFPSVSPPGPTTWVQVRARRTA